VVELRPGFARWLKVYAFGLKEWGKINEALPVYKAITVLRPEDPNAFRDYGLALEGQGRLISALHQYDKVAKGKWDNRLLSAKTVAQYDIARVVRSIAYGLLDQAATAAAATPPASYLPEGLFFRLEKEVSEGILRIFEKEVPDLIDRLDIRSIVEEKVNRLDLLEVEALIEGILNRELKAITLFGAVLGALVGLLNVFVLLP